jgi:nucleoid-associated protein YgaU
MTRHPTLGERLKGLAASALLLLLVVGFPLVLVAIGAAPWDADLSRLRTLLTSPDDGTLALAVVAVVGWIAWAVMTTSIGLAVHAQLRGLHAPSIPGLAMPQRAAGQLVATAALLFVAAPSMVPAFPTPPARAAPPPAMASRSIEAVTHPTPVAAPALTPVTEPATEKTAPATIDYTVKRGDSLWRIADRLLGDGARYTEIVDLNRGVLDGRPDFIVPGTVLVVPLEVSDAPADGTASERYVVRPGETLSEIAQDELGDSMRYPELFQASRNTVQPDGARLTDPDLIRPGWMITISQPAEHSESAVEPPEVRTSPRVDNTDPPTGSSSTPPSPSGPAEARDTVGSGAEVADEAESSIGWLAPGLIGAGGLLAGALLIAVRAHQRTQQRYRRPGLAVAPPPPEARSVEKTVTTTGTPTAEVTGRLDALLRHLAATTEHRPKVGAVEVDSRAVTLHLVEPADLPDPWRGSDATWATDVDTPVSDADELPPYPLLASMGQDDDGRWWLLDLEQLGSVGLVGDREHARALARHLAAELALNPWSVIAEIDTIDIGAELAALDPGRLHHHGPEDVEFLARIREELEAAQQDGFGDPEPFHALLVTDAARGEEVQAVVEAVRGQRSRLGLAVVTIATTAAPGDAAIEVTAEGRLRVPHVGLDLTAAGLSAEEAAACAAIVDLTRDAEVVPIPRQEGATGWRVLADQAGALVGDLTEQRPAGEAGETSLLPEATQRYEAVSAVTAEDVDGLAPLVPEESRRTVEDSDPQLDHDLAEWRDPDSPLPKLRLLGPVTATARGGVPRVAERKAFFTELLAYLALHPAGVSARQVEEAFGIKRSRARTDLSLLREWLGVNPRTGLQHLPPATSSPAHAERGTGGYQLSDVLIDLDLFRRLRARAQAHGANGIEDLVDALELVSGEPFTCLRDHGWTWLLDEERVHETATLAVVDVAHVVVTDALSRDDADRARFAAETACRAAPYDDICRLDLAKVAEAEGHGELAEQILDQHVFNRTDDHLPPIDLPARTAQVVKSHGWGHPRRPEND